METELCRDILIRVLEQSEVKIEGIDRIIESQCYMALTKIIKIVSSPHLKDEECFMQIEQIVLELEKLGFNGELRHDFG